MGGRSGRNPTAGQLLPLRPDRPAAGDDRRRGKAAVVRQLWRLGQTHGGNQYCQCAPAVPVAEPVLRRGDGAALQLLQVLRPAFGAVCYTGPDRGVGRGESVHILA